MSSSLVLLNPEGEVEKRLNFISPPGDYIVPEGMMLSWKIELTQSSERISWFRERAFPTESYFYLGAARAMVECVDFKIMRTYPPFLGSGSKECGVHKLRITVQSKVAEDLTRLKDEVMSKIQSGKRIEVVNDLNPRPARPGFFRRLFTFQWCRA